MVEKLYSVDEAAQFLTDAAKMTAEHSKNWENYKTICCDMLRAALEAKGGVDVK